MTETEQQARKRKGEVPLEIYQQKKPPDGVLNGQPYTWLAIRENPDKPRQIQGWRRIPRPGGPGIDQPRVDQGRIDAWQDTVSPEDATEERMRKILENQQNQPPKPE